MANRELKSLLNDAKNWKGMTEEERRSLLLALKELLINLGILQNSAEHYLNKLQHNLEASENAEELNANIKEFISETGKAAFSSKVNEILHPDRFARAAMATQVEQLHDLMEHAEEFMLSMNEETARAISQKAADAAAMIQTLEKRETLSAKEAAVLVDKVQSTMDDIEAERQYGEHIVQVTLDTINKDKDGGWCVLDAPGTDGFAVMAAMNHLDSTDQISIMYVTPKGNWRSAHNLDEVNEFMKEHFPDAKGFPLDKDTLTVSQKLPENVEFRDIGGAFEGIRNKMQRGQDEVMFAHVKAETDVRRMNDEMEAIKKVIGKKTVEANIYTALSQMADIKLRDIAADVDFVHPDGKTDKSADDVVGFEVKREESKFHKKTLGKIRVDFDMETGMVSKVQYFENKNNTNSGKHVLYSQNGTDIGMGFTGIEGKANEELKLMLQTLPADVREQVLPFIAEVEKQNSLNRAIGKKDEQIRTENDKLGAILQHIDRQDGFEYSIIGGRVDITNDDLQGNKVVMAYVDGNPRMYIETPELAALEEKLVKGEVTAEDYRKAINDLTVATQGIVGEGKNQAFMWVTDKDITMDALHTTIKDEAILAAVTAAVMQVENEFIKGVEAADAAELKSQNEKADKAIEEEAEQVLD